MKSNVGLWSATCAVKVVRNIVAAAVATAAVALVFEHMSEVIELLRVVSGGGGYWHTWALCATPAVVAAYLSCLSNNRTLPRLFRRNAGRWSGRLACLAFFGTMFAMVFWRASLWRSYNCFGDGWLEQCSTDWSTWKICAGFALLVFVFLVGISSDEHPAKEVA